MNNSKAKAFLKKHREALEEEYQYLGEDAFSSGPMCYEQSRARDYACQRRDSIEKELTELNDILGEINETKC